MDMTSFITMTKTLPDAVCLTPQDTLKILYSDTKFVMIHDKGLVIYKKCGSQSCLIRAS